MAKANTNDQAHISADFGLTKSQQFGEHVGIKFEHYFVFIIITLIFVYAVAI